MQITQKDPDGLKREFSVVVKASDIAGRIEQRLAQIAGEVKMPGFREGKVPPAVVKSRYGKQVLGDVVQAVVDEAARKAVTDNNLQVATNPGVNMEQYSEGDDLKLTIAFEVMPEIKPVDLGKLKITRPVVEVTDKEVEDNIARIAEDNKPTKPVAAPRAIKAGDTAVIDFTGRVAGETFEGGSAKGHALTIGSGTFIPGFEEGLIGAMPGSTVEVKVTFPENYPAENLKGRDAVFEVAITELREPGEVKIDDDFAKTLGLPDLAALRKAVQDGIARQHATASRNLVKTAVLDALDEATEKFDVPPSLLANEYNNICRATNPAAQTRAQAGGEGQPPPADEGMAQKDKDEADAIARRRVRLGMMLTVIGRKAEITVSDEETNQAVMAEARRHPGQEQQVLDYFKQNPGAAQQLAGPIFEDKVINHVLDAAVVTDKPMSAEDLYKTEPEDEAAKAKKSPGSKNSTAGATDKAKKGKKS